MLEDAKISPKQLILLIVISRMVITITFFPVLDSPPGNQDVWLALLLSIPIHLLLSVPIYLLWKRFPNQSFVEYSQTILGRAGKLIGLLYVLYFLHDVSMFLYRWSAFLTTAIMPETPVLFILIFLLPFCAYAVLKGFEVIARFAKLFAPFIFAGFIIIFLLLAKDMDLKVFTPFLEKSFLSILLGAFVVTLRTSEILIFAMLLPYVNIKKAKEVKLIFLSTFSIFTFLWIICVIVVLSTLGLDLPRVLQFSYFDAVRLVNIGGFIERIESIHLSMWLISGYLRVALYFYVIVIGLSQVFGLKSYKPLVLSILTILIPISLALQTNIADLNQFLNYHIEPWYNLFFIFFIPVILLLIAMIRKQGEIKP